MDQIRKIGLYLLSLLRGVKDRWQSWSTAHPRWALFIKVGSISIGSIFLLMLFFILSIYFGAFGKVPTYPDLQNIRNYIASEVYSEDEVLLGKYYIENRANADFEELSPYLIQALVATEDARFFDHHGIDFRALGRVMVRSIMMGDERAGGGSTLSQQLAKNLFKRQDHGKLTMPVNKVREMIIARRLERIYTKEELLRLYLNTVPFSENIFGVKLAAQRFFGSAPDSLSIEQAALLVGTLKATGTYNPLQNPEDAFNRRNTVLSQLGKYGYVDTSLVDSLQQIPLNLASSSETTSTELAAYFREELRQELDLLLEDYTKPDGSSYNLYTDGLRIYTTIDSRMQRYAEEAVNEQMKILQNSFDQHWKGRKLVSDALFNSQMERSERYQTWKAKGLSEDSIQARMEVPVSMVIFDWEEGERSVEMSPKDSIIYYLSILQAGFLAMEPESGKVRAWVGGIAHDYFKYDHVLSSRQVGSIFKPVVYAAALEKGINPCEYRANELVSYPEYEDWTPENADGKYEDYYTMAGGLQHSVNTIAVDLLFQTGLDTVMQMARGVGLDGDIPEAPAIALGALEASLLEMVEVYGTFANRGSRPEPYYLTRIETASGELIADFTEYTEPDWYQAYSSQTGAILVELLESVVDSGTAKRLRYQYYVPGAIAGKTGTTQNQSDGWFVGFTPNLVAGSWVGADYPEVRWRSLSLGQGSNTALPIWGRFMRKVYKDPAFKQWQYAQFPVPDTSITKMLDCYPVLPFIPDSIFAGKDEFLQKVLEGFFGEASDDPLNEETRRQTILDELERIEQERERWEKKQDRKKRRKEFFDDIFNRDPDPDPEEGGGG